MPTIPIYRETLKKSLNQMAKNVEKILSQIVLNPFLRLISGLSIPDTITIYVKVLFGPLLLLPIYILTYIVRIKLCIVYS